MIYLNIEIMKKIWLVILLISFVTSNLFAQQQEYEITQEQQVEINRRVKLRLCEFHDLLESLANKEYIISKNSENGQTMRTGKKITSEREARILIKDAANRYFAYKEESLIEVTNSKNKKSRRNISPYLLGLYKLSYRKVDIEFTNIYIVSKFKQGENGLFYGTVVVDQRFTGTGEFRYADRTFKSFEIIVDVDPNDPYKMDVQIGNILVTEKEPVDYQKI